MTDPKEALLEFRKSLEKATQAYELYWQRLLERYGADLLPNHLNICNSPCAAGDFIMKYDDKTLYCYVRPAFFQGVKIKITIPGSSNSYGTVWTKIISVSGVEKLMRNIDIPKPYVQI